MPAEAPRMWTAQPSRSRGAWRNSRLDDSAALLAQELGDVVGPTSAFAGRDRGLPAAKRVRAGPGPRGRARPLVGVAHAGFNFVEEPRDLVRAAGEDAGGQSVFGVVDVCDGLVEARHLAH